MDHYIRPIVQGDHSWIAKRLSKNWGSPLIISRGKTHDASKLPGFVALYEGEEVGFVTYRIIGQDCELVTLDSWRQKCGVGSNLIGSVKHAAIKARCSRLWLVTTNDNLNALGFFQKRGFHLVAVHPDALAESRKIKPFIPEIGLHGIPLRDEIELQLLID